METQGRAEPVAHQELGEQPAERVAHDDRRSAQCGDGLGEVVHDVGDAYVGQDGGVFPQGGQPAGPGSIPG